MMHYIYKLVYVNIIYKGTICIACKRSIILTDYSRMYHRVCSLI